MWEQREGNGRRQLESSGSREILTMGGKHGRDMERKEASRNKEGAAEFREGQSRQRAGKEKEAGGKLNFKNGGERGRDRARKENRRKEIRRTAGGRRETR